MPGRCAAPAARRAPADHPGAARRAGLPGVTVGLARRAFSMSSAVMQVAFRILLARLATTSLAGLLRRVPPGRAAHAVRYARCRPAMLPGRPSPRGRMPAGMPWLTRRIGAP